MLPSLAPDCFCLVFWTGSNVRVRAWLYTGSKMTVGSLTRACRWKVVWPLFSCVSFVKRVQLILSTVIHIWLSINISINKFWILLSAFDVYYQFFFQVSSINDKADFKAVGDALKVLGFLQQEIDILYKTVACVLHFVCISSYLLP